jgi:hypothetical protein
MLAIGLIYLGSLGVFVELAAWAPELPWHD